MKCGNGICKTYQNPIIFMKIRKHNYTWQYKASPLLSTIRRVPFTFPVSLRILFYCLPAH